MAPVGMVGTLGWLSSPEVGIISLIVFLILSVTLLALCMRCKRETINAYDMNAKTDGAGKPNGTQSGVATDPEGPGWRDHASMPRYSLERTHPQAS